MSQLQVRRRLSWTAITRGAAAAGILTAFANCDMDPCGNTAIREVLAPNNARKAVVYERGCGAMTSRAGTWVAVMAPDDSLPPSDTPPGVVFYNDNRGPEGRDARLGVDVSWESDSTLLIRLSPGPRVLFAAVVDHGVRVRYDTVAADREAVADTSHGDR